MVIDKVKHIIKSGELNSYWIDSSFIEIYWEHNGLPLDNYYLFNFNAIKYEFKQIHRVLVVTGYRIKKILRILQGILDELLTNIDYK